VVLSIRAILLALSPEVRVAARDAGGDSIALKPLARERQHFEDSHA